MKTQTQPPATVHVADTDIAAVTQRYCYHGELLSDDCPYCAEETGNSLPNKGPQGERLVYAAALNFLSFLGAMAGRDVYHAVGPTRHHARLFTLHVGRSGCGRKGDALGLVKMIAAAVGAADPALLGRVHSGGLSSREGLACLIHDGYKVGREEFKPIPDKRLWVRESEFANVLHQAKRDGNTLSPALRDGWDGESIDPATKSNRVGVTRPHIGIAAGISPGELLSVINSRELSNGFANRFLTVHAERLCLVAEPAPPPPQVVAALAGRTAEVIRFALGGYPETSDTRPMHKSAAAKEFYRAAYHSLCQPMETELLTTLLERRAPHLIRLAMLFALCDLTLVIELHHMQAALAWIDYHTDSVRYIFGRSGQQERTRRREAMAGQIAEFLKGRPEGASRMELYNDCFGKHVTPLPLDDVLKMMLADHRYGLSEIRTPRADGKAGRPKLVYRMSKLPAQESQELFNPNNPATALVADETDGAKESNSSAN